VLVLLASIGVVLGAMAARRAPPQAAPPPGEAASASVVEPSPLPNGATPERIPMPDPETDPGCSFADRGFGAYGAWRSLPFGKALVPPAGRAASTTSSFTSTAPSRCAARSRRWISAW